MSGEEDKWFEENTYEPEINRIILKVYKEGLTMDEKARESIVNSIFCMHNSIDCLILANNVLSLSVRQVLMRFPENRVDNIVEASEIIGKALANTLVDIMGEVQSKYKLQPIEGMIALANAIVSIMSKALREVSNDEGTMVAFTFEVLRKVLLEYPEIADEVLDNMLKRY